MAVSFPPVTIDIPFIGPTEFDLPTFGGGGPGPVGSVCPAGTVWRGFPWEPWVCDPIGSIPGGATSPIPSSFNPTPGGDCIWPSRPNPFTGECEVFMGDTPGPDPTPSNGFRPGASGSRIHGEFFHTDTVPRRVSVSVRRCPPGHVLGKDRWCHPKGSIPNKERLYPKPPRPLGSVREMKCVTVAGQFARRLKSKKKTLNKLATALASK